MLWPSLSRSQSNGRLCTDVLHSTSIKTTNWKYILHGLCSSVQWSSRDLENSHLLVCGGQTPYQEVTRDLFVTATRPKSSEKLEYWYSSNWTLVCFIWGMKATLCDFGIISKLLLNLFADHWNRPGSNLYKQSMQLCKIISKGHLKLWMGHCMFVCFSVPYSVWLFISRSTS